MTQTGTRWIGAILAAMLALGAPATAQEYRIGPGDQLAIEVLEDETLNRNLVVLPSGTVNFPYVGNLRVAGRTPTQVSASIAAGMSGVLATTPTVFVSVVPDEPEPFVPPPQEPDPTIDVYMLGEVAGPGLKTVKPGTTFLQAMAQAGGLTRFAATKRVQLRRPGGGFGAPQLYLINYDALLRGAALTQDITLQEGDVILVPERKLFE